MDRAMYRIEGLVGEVLTLSIESAQMLARLLNISENAALEGLGKTWEQYSLHQHSQITVDSVNTELALIHGHEAGRVARLTIFLEENFVWPHDEVVALSL